MESNCNNRNRYRLTGLFLILLLCIGPLNVKGVEPYVKQKKWIGTWVTALQLVEPGNMPPLPGLQGNTLRQVVCVSAGGKKLRLSLSNQYGEEPVTLKKLQIAVSKGEGAIYDLTSKPLLFNGKQEVTIQPGAVVVSDPVNFDLEPRTELAITAFFGKVPSKLTGHPGSRTTSYLLAGDHTGLNGLFNDAIRTDHWYMISAIEVEGEKSAAAVAVLGDSITDGRGSGTNKQNRWPDIFANAIYTVHKGRQTGVLNLGIGGNCVLKGGLGPTALSRFDRDIIQQKGLRWLILFEGVNDLGSTRDSASAFQVAQALINAYEKMIDTSHTLGIKVYGGTILPFKGSGYYTTFRDAARNKVNDWIRASGRFDAVIDFDKVMRDPGDLTMILAEAQTGDHLHPNELGYRMMGKAVDPMLFN